MAQNVSLCDRSDIVMLFLVLKAMSSTLILNDRTHKTAREATAVSSWVGCPVLLTSYHWFPLFQFITQQQMKILQTAIEDHETKLKNAKDMCDTFLKVW